MNNLKWNKDFISKVGKEAFNLLTSKKTGNGGPVSFILKLVNLSSENPPVKEIKDPYMNLTLDPTFANRFFRVYFNKDKKVAFLIHSPTDPNNFEDIIADILLALSIV